MNETKAFKLAAIQMNSENDKRVNLEKASKFIGKAAQEKASIVALPEMFYFSGKAEEKKENAETVPGPTINFLAEIARELNIYLLCGSILEKVEEKDKEVFYNSSVFLNPEGKIIAKYRKIHLFDVKLPDGSSRQESKVVTGGARVVEINTPLAHFGFSICYDIRFPELYRRLVREGTQIVFVPSAFTLQTGKDHWEILVRARAIENQLYIVAPDQIGEDNYGRKSWGKSMIVDPWGTPLAKASEKEGIILAEVDLSYQKRIKENLPCLSHRREDIFDF